MNALPSLAQPAHGASTRTARSRLRGVARAAARARRGRPVAGHAAGSTSACPTTRSSPTAPATTRCGCIGSTATAAFARNWRPTPARWATACRRRSPPRPCTRERIVVSWNGDGCFLMNGQELATAVQYGLAVIFVVIDNGDVRDDPHAPGAPLSRRACRAPTSSIRISRRSREPTARTARPCVRTDEFAPAFERAVAAGRPALLHVKIDPQALTMNASLDALRAQGEAAGRR